MSYVYRDCSASVLYIQSFYEPLIIIHEQFVFRVYRNNHVFFRQIREQTACEQGNVLLLLVAILINII